MIQTQILLTNIIRIVWETERRITYETLGVKGLKKPQLLFSYSYLLGKLLTTLLGVMLQSPIGLEPSTNVSYHELTNV